MFVICLCFGGFGFVWRLGEYSLEFVFRVDRCDI